MGQLSERGIFRKKIGMGFGCARRSLSPLAEHLMLQKYLDLRPPVSRRSQHAIRCGRGLSKVAARLHGHG
jgi:hypothetical protein